MPRKRYYGVFRVVGSTYYGYVEHSFKMGWSKEYVRVWEKKDLEGLRKSFKSRKNVYILRLTREDCLKKFGLIFNFHEFLETRKQPNVRKYFYRNMSFQVYKDLNPLL